MDKIEKTIKNNSDIVIIFYTEDCPYSMNAIELLKQKNIKFKGYKINKITNSLPEFINILKKLHENNKIDFNLHHKTKPIIFNKTKFVGGYTELLTLTF